MLRAVFDHTAAVRHNRLTACEHPLFAPVMTMAFTSGLLCALRSCEKSASNTAAAGGRRAVGWAAGGGAAAAAGTLRCATTPGAAHLSVPARGLAGC